MPRKPNPPPAILRIENLSTGIDPTLVDDFTGLLLAQPLAKPPRIDNAQAHFDRLKQAKVAQAETLLQSVGIPKDGRLSQPITRPWTDRLAYAKRTSVRRMADAKVAEAEVRLSQPAILKPEVVTLQRKEWRRL